MKIFISADIEGITGVTSWASTRYGGKDYETACRQMSLEVAAACRGAIAAGCQVVVKDGHEDAMNIDADLLPRGVELIRGWSNDPRSMLGGLDQSFDGALYIGYHSGAWTNTSPLKHTGEDYLFNWVKVNGELASEFTLNSILADQMGVPSLFLAGDEGICCDASAEYPGIVTVATKSGVGNATWNRHPQDVIEEIERKVAEVLSAPLPESRPMADSYTMEINFKDFQRARGASWYPGAEVIDGFTVSITEPDPWKLAIARMYMTSV
ncbi:M55 family metallopeptidase [Ihubacter sp. mB4P-1]|uniref:M55 family metallopeptidase n=1 Tax=Ihubacter sp. mB4P-1 TaxID=3242370 RepID=UPI00137A7000